METQKSAYSISDLCQRLGLSRPSVYSLLKSDGFPAFRVGRRWLVPVQELQEWLATQAKKR